LRIFGPKRNEVAGSSRRLHSEELRNLYASPNIISVIKSRRVRWEGHVACMGEMRSAYIILVGKPERKNYLEDRHKWKDNIRIDLREIGWEVVDWICLAQDRDWWWAHVNMVMNLKVS
jgi:hypothetical protein